mmetsp:Transcript_19408/g.45478  ORF Transcript_19408/g.45478 Transcript_19408/m.45478 type:complete len:237 (-) Transcript_19408:84-794(-)
MPATGLGISALWATGERAEAASLPGSCVGFFVTELSDFRVVDFLADEPTLVADCVLPSTSFGDCDINWEKSSSVAVEAFFLPGFRGVGDIVLPSLTRVTFTFLMVFFLFFFGFSSSESESIQLSSSSLSASAFKLSSMDSSSPLALYSDPLSSPESSSDDDPSNSISSSVSSRICLRFLEVETFLADGLRSSPASSFRLPPIILNLSVERSTRSLSPSSYSISYTCADLCFRTRQG